METALKKDIYEHLAPVWSGSFSRDFTSESIVPDAMPDVASVIDADGVITLRSKETERRRAAVPDRRHAGGAAGGRARRGYGLPDGGAHASAVHRREDGQFP